MNRTVFACIALSLAACGGKSKPAEAPPPPLDDSPPAIASAGRAPIAVTGLAGCDEYVALLASFMDCDKLPPDARNGGMAGAQSLLDGWAELSSMPEDARAQTDDACRQGVDALRQGAESMGCTLSVPEGDYVAEIRAFEGTGSYEQELSPDANAQLTHCDGYTTAVQTFVACDKVPQQARDAAQQGLDAMKAGWNDFSSLPDDQRIAIDNGCIQATDAIHQSMDALGCAY